MKKLRQIHITLIVLIVGLLTACQSLEKHRLNQNNGIIDESGSVSIKDRWGVEILSLRATAAGYMLDFRYRVLDPDKAAPLMDRSKNAYVVVEKSGVHFGVPTSPKIGALRTMPKTVKKDTNYYAMFANPRRHILAGDQVTVVIGDFRAEHLTVQ